VNEEISTPVVDREIYCRSHKFSILCYLLPLYCIRLCKPRRKIWEQQLYNSSRLQTEPKTSARTG
jgi:hypothetical protein